jgi:hypothetical protein
MTREEEALLAQVTSAHRTRTVDGEVTWHPAWFDLGAPLRAEAFEETLRQRKLEQALDPEGLSSTARALLARLT